MVQLFGNNLLANTPGPSLPPYQWPPKNNAWSTATDDVVPTPDYLQNVAMPPLWLTSQTPAAPIFNPMPALPPAMLFPAMPPPALSLFPPPLLAAASPQQQHLALSSIAGDQLHVSGPPSISAGSDGSREFAQMTPVLNDTPPPPVELPVSKQLQRVWHGQFDKLFGQFVPDMWHLIPLGEQEPPKEEQGWLFFKDSAKVRFECTDCCHCWTSMKGRVCFWFSLFDITDGVQLRREGSVIFKLFGQGCNKCNGEKIYHAMWYPEEVEKVITNVYSRVGQMYYNFVRPQIRIERRRGRPRQQHNSDCCEACKMGVCQKEWEFR